jgi:hypothetical protein
MKKKLVFFSGGLFVFFITTMPAFSQDQQNPNDIITQMQHDLNLSEDQVANITQIIDRYADASNDLQKSIADGTINPSDVDSQKQQIKAAEDQGIAQYLRSDQLLEWNNIESQSGQQGDKGGSDGGAGAQAGASDAADEYSNLPQPSSKN